MREKAKTSGLIAGRFMPVDAGHIFSLDFARSFVDRLYVLIVRSGHEPAAQPAALARERAHIAELAPGAMVTTATLAPLCPEDERGQVECALAGLSSLAPDLPQSFDFFFAPGAWGFQAAARIGARFVPVAPPPHHDFCRPDRKAEEPIRRVCLFGPESTGKSTLATNLASHFGTVAVPEYARTHIDLRGNIVEESDLPVFARGQAAAEDAMAGMANRVLFCDTDAIITAIWSRWLFGRCDRGVLALAESRRYDLYLLTDIDVPWVADPQRYLPEDRERFFADCRDELDSRKRPYRIISGSWAERMRHAVAAVETLLEKGSRPQAPC